MSPVIGVVEVIGAAMLLVPGLAAYAALLLGTVMLVALISLVTHPSTGMGAGGTPAVYLAVLVIIGVVRWKDRRRQRTE